MERSLTRVLTQPGKKKKAFINKKDAAVFHIVARSQHSSHADASRYVLQKNNEVLHREDGVQRIALLQAPTPADFPKELLMDEDDMSHDPFAGEDGDDFEGDLDDEEFMNNLLGGGAGDKAAAKGDRKTSGGKPAGKPAGKPDQKSR